VARGVSTAKGERNPPVLSSTLCYGAGPIRVQCRHGCYGKRTGIDYLQRHPGEAAILVRYLDHVAVCRVTVPRPGVAVERPEEYNFIDRHVWDKLQRLGIEPSGLADDATFLRRVFLDTIGTLPTVGEARDFLADTSFDKRTQLINSLLRRNEYADYWTMRWLNLMRADQLKTTPQGTVAMQRWLRHQFRTNRPFDELAVELVTAQGNTAAEGPAAFYTAMNKPDETARTISQLMLGVRIQCAQCHHHPSEKWSQADYVGLAGLFTGVTQKGLPGGGKVIVSSGGEDLPHPRTTESIGARALGAEPADFTGTRDRRRRLADDTNPFFFQDHRQSLVGPLLWSRPGRTH
jgi:hypothetical protein